VREIYLSLTNHPGQLSLAIPPWVGAMSTGHRVVFCDWGVKADMVLFAGNTAPPTRFYELRRFISFYLYLYCIHI